MPDIFKNCNCIREINRILAKFNKTAEYLTHVGKVEIAGHNKIFRSPVIFTAYRMNIIDIIISICSVPQVSEINIAGKRDIFLYECRIIESFGVRLCKLIKILIDHAENLF